MLEWEDMLELGLQKTPWWCCSPGLEGNGDYRAEGNPDEDGGGDGDGNGDGNGAYDGCGNYDCGSCVVLRLWMGARMQLQPAH